MSKSLLKIGFLQAAETWGYSKLRSVGWPLERYKKWSLKRVVLDCDAPGYLLFLVWIDLPFLTFCKPSLWLVNLHFTDYGSYGDGGYSKGGRVRGGSKGKGKKEPMTCHVTASIFPLCFGSGLKPKPSKLFLIFLSDLVSFFFCSSWGAFLIFPKVLLLPILFCSALVVENYYWFSKIIIEFFAFRV